MIWSCRSRKFLFEESATNSLGDITIFIERLNFYGFFQKFRIQISPKLWGLRNIGKQSWYWQFMIIRIPLTNDNIWVEEFSRIFSNFPYPGPWKIVKNWKIFLGNKIPLFLLICSRRSRKFLFEGSATNSLGEITIFIERLNFLEFSLPPTLKNCEKLKVLSW